jgi:hypothetical protein
VAGMVVVAGILAGRGEVFAIELADVKVQGWKLSIGAETLSIKPATVKSATWDGALKDGKPGWRGPTLLPGSAWAYAALHVDTLVVTLADDSKVKLEAGKDFAIDPKWGAIAAIKDGKYPAGTKIHCEYKYGMSRLDLVVRGADGKLKVIEGTEDKTMPVLPAAPQGHTPVFSVYLPNGARELSPGYINIIDPAYDGIPQVVRPELLQPVRDKMQTGKPVTFVFLGDSITEMADKNFRDGKGSFVNRFAAHLRSTYPESEVVVVERGKPAPEPKDRQIRVIKAGVGGDDTVRALKRLDRDVLAFKPDVVNVMLGVNDENRTEFGTNNIPVPVYKMNLLHIAGRIRVAGGVVMFMTPSMKNLQWEGSVGNMWAYAQAMREVSEIHKCVLIDAHRAWEGLPKRGYNYMVFLGNCINHPVDLGHDLFVRGLQEAFK